MKKAMINTSLRKNDRVMVVSGRDKGKTGKILMIDLQKGRAVVEGINRVKRHTKPGPTTKGGILDKEASIHLSNIMLICPACTDPVRISKKIIDDGSKVRICKKCGEEVPTEKK